MNFLAANWKFLFCGISLLVFVVIQHSIFISLKKACRDFMAALDAPDRAGGAGGFVWLKNVRAMFAQASGGWLENSPLPRDAVIDTLDNELWRTSRYSALQRWGLAAPLIGVILTALGFMVSPPDLNGEVSDIMTKLGPLFMGVLVGAVMALINQVYLHLAAQEIVQVRAKAVHWFDDVVWRSIRQNAGNALGQAAAATQDAVKHLEKTSSELAACNTTYRDSLLELNRQLATVREAAHMTSNTFDAFSLTFGEMNEQIRASIRALTALNETSAAVENSSAIWNAAAVKVNNASTLIEGSSQKLLDTCGNFSTNFDDVRRTLKVGITESTGGLVNAVNRLMEPIRKLEGSIQQMQTNTDRHSELSVALNGAVKQFDQYIQERMALNIDEADLQREMATRTRVAIDSLQQLANAAGSVNNTGNTMNAAATGLRDASVTIGNVLNSLFETCNGFASRCAELQGTMNNNVVETTSQLQNAAHELSNGMSRVSANTENHAALAARLDQVARQAERFLQERAKAGAAEFAQQTRMEQTEKRLEESAKQLSETTHAIQRLEHGVETLVEELRAARKETSRGKWLSWLSKSNPIKSDNKVTKDVI